MEVKNYGNVDAVDVSVTVNVTIRNHQSTAMFNIGTLKGHESVLIPGLVINIGKTRVTIDAEASAKNEPKINLASNKQHKAFEFLLHLWS